MLKVRRAVESVFSSGSGDLRRPALGRGSESSVKGLFVIGDLAGAPVIKQAMAQGVEVIDFISSLPDMRHIAGGAGKGTTAPAGTLDVLVIGAGAAGLNAALAAQDKGFSCLVLEKEKIANTIENFPEGKWIYAEPESKPPKGKLWLDGARKEELVARWHGIIRDNRLEVRTEEPLVSLEKRKDGTFLARTPKGEYSARKVVLATGLRGVPRRLGAPGEDQERVYHRLYSPRHYKDEEILVVGGGNSAIEAALALAERNRVVLSYRGGEFTRLFKENRRKLDEAVAQNRIEVVFHSRVREFRPRADGDADQWGAGSNPLAVREAGRPSLPEGSDPGRPEAEGHSGSSGTVAGFGSRSMPLKAVLAIDRGGRSEERTISADHVFVLIGAGIPAAFLTSLGIRLENDWRGHPLRAAALTIAALVGAWFLGGAPSLLGRDLSFVPPWVGGLGLLACLAALVATGIRGDRWSWLGLSLLVGYSVYGIKYGAGEEFWPYRGWGYQAMSFLDRPWSFWYTVLYTALMTVFGIRALKRWGLDRKDRFQIWRYTSLLSFQWVFFFIIPEFLFGWAVKYQWVGEKLAADPQFAQQAWRSYGIVYAWPLFFYTFFYDPHTIWIVWGVLVSFVIIPVLVLFHGKRYCSWICGCGGLAETVGDQWRHLAPKGKGSIRWEGMNLAILALASAVTIAMLGRDVWSGLARPADWGIHLYRLLADTWLVGILPVTLYPFLGGKIWCRYWCPLAALMQIESWVFTKTRLSRFRIVANDKCIACNECSRYCQVGIDVMDYALKQEPLDNATSSCIGCGICVSVCPMDTLSFGSATDPALQLYRPGTAGH